MATRATHTHSQVTKVTHTHKHSYTRRPAEPGGSAYGAGVVGRSRSGVGDIGCTLPLTRVRCLLQRVSWRFGLRTHSQRWLPRGAMGDRRHAHLSEEEIAECAAAHASLAREASHSLLSERRARSTRPPCAYLRFREIFNLVDLDKGGTISKEELKQLMNTLGLKPSQASTAHSPSARRTATHADTQGHTARAGGAEPDGGRDRCGQQRRD